MTLKELLLGRPKSPLDPRVFERLALAAFLAWVGLGADGLSSSCYGPEEIFVALGPHRALAPFLIAAIAVTVSVLSAAYATTIQAFPGGGGGYIVATKTLGTPRVSRSTVSVSVSVAPAPTCQWRLESSRSCSRKSERSFNASSNGMPPCVRIQLTRPRTTTVGAIA